jgi:integrase
MAKQIQRLTAAAVKSAKAGLHPDGGGLYLQVTPSRTAEGQLNKSWLFRFVMGGRERQMGLGSLKTYGLADAREQARKCRQMVVEGQDPIAERDARKVAKQKAESTTSPTFERCAINYMAAHEAGWRNAKHRYQWTATLRTYAFPVIGRTPIDAVGTDDILKILTPIWATKNETASRLRGRIETILDAAKVARHRTGENPARWQGHLEHLLAARKSVRKGGRQAALPWADIPEFMRELRAMPGIAPRALEFAILTASRSGEVRGMPWSEVAGDVWVIPASRMKGGAEHRVALPGLARAILAEMEMTRLGDLVFPGDGGDEPLSDMTLTAVVRRMNEARGKSRRPPWTDPKQGGRTVVVHGFRSSFRDWVQEATDFPDWLAEAALAHASGDKVEAAYKRGDALKKRRRLMEAWAQYCAGTRAGKGEGNNIVPIRADVGRELRDGSR